MDSDTSLPLVTANEPLAVLLVADGLSRIFASSSAVVTVNPMGDSFVCTQTALVAQV